MHERIERHGHLKTKTIVRNTNIGVGRKSELHVYMDMYMYQTDYNQASVCLLYKQQ